MATEIKLTRGYVAIVDDCDADLAEFKWHATPDAYAQRDNDGLKNIRLHRVILARKLNRDLLDSELTDHRDTNHMNCRRGNLRVANKIQNSSNRSLNKNNVSGFKGVAFDKYMKSRPYIAKIGFQGASISLGRFDNPLDAHRTYVIAALTYHGDFANLGEGSPFTGFTLDDFEKPVIQLALPLKDAA